MQIAYLIVAHHNFAHLQRLIDGLNHAGVQFFIHIDKKAGMPPGLKGPVTFIDSQKVYWAGYSQVQVTLKLMRAAKLKADFDYYILLSGVDYPIKSNEWLIDKLSREKGEYINILEGFQETKPALRLTKFHWQRINRRVNSPWVKALKALERITYSLGLRNEVKIKPFVGSNWFALSGDCVKYIFEFLDANPEYELAFTYSLCADELFFHTIIGNSPYFEKCTHCLHFADWSVPDPPALIGEKHLRMFKETETLSDSYGAFQPFLARKFSDESETLVREIEETLRTS